MSKKHWAALAIWLAAAWRGVTAEPPGVLAVETSPPGAQVYVDGTWRGITPCRLEEVRRGRLELRKDGFVTAHEWAREGEIFLRLRPGVTPPGPPSALPGFYPPSRGRPPFCWFLKKTANVQGHPYAAPPEWRERQPQSWSIGDDQEAPLRFASLSVQPGGSLPTFTAIIEQEREREGWVTVWRESRGHQVLLRFERGNSRAATLLQLEEGLRVAELDYEFPNCFDPFAYTRDLDILRAALGFEI